MPENAKKRKSVVPANSALVAMKWLRNWHEGQHQYGNATVRELERTLSGIHPSHGTRLELMEDPGREVRDC